MAQGSKKPQLSTKANSVTVSAGVLADFIPLLTAIFQDSPDCVAIYANDASIIYANESFENTWGYPLQQVQNSQKTASEHFQPYHNALDNVLTTGQSTTLLLDCKPSNMRRHIHDLISMTAIRSQEQVVLGVIAIGRNLGDYRHTQYQMLAQKERYQRALIDNFPFMVWLKDVDSRYLAINNAFAQLAGVTHPEEVLGKTDYDCFFKVSADSCVASDREVLLSGESKVLVESIHPKSGDVHWAEVYKSPVLIDGEVVGTVGFARDLSDIKKLQADILKTKSDYMTLVESLPLTISRYDLNFKCIFMSSYCERITGVPAEYMLGKTPSEFLHLHHLNLTAEDVEAYMAQVIATAEPHVFELHGYAEDKDFTYLMRILPEFDVDKNVVGVMILGSDISEISEYREQLEHMAHHDALTSLPNRTMFNKRITSAINHAKRQKHLLGIFVIDLDHFKSINDTLGHVIGDALLIDVATRILNTLRAGDSVARLGGDEFAIMIQDVSKAEDLAVLAAKILQILALPFYVAGQELYVTASVGIAVYPRDSQHIDDLLKFADVAMYAAKKQGRNNYQFFVQELNQLMSQRFQVQTELMHAIEKNELYLQYQPLVRLDTEEIIGVEALLRWKNSVLGELRPAEFIPLAEELGIITEIGRWVMMQAVKDAVTVNLQREKPLMFSVNLSARQFLRYDILAAIKYCLSVTGCKPVWVTLEITESLLLNDSKQVLNILSSLVDLGVKIAIDDFGTGYSSLSYLNKFPISEVKIDRSFVREITTVENDAKLVKAVIGMAISLGKELVAEGVETQAQADLLKNWGCHIGQGYLFSKPLGFEQLLLRLK
ncbi:EAL domain-containing protein [Methylotenera versatilis]|uniref:bifunctional diguanylate cyclase/phosphodiesterase n=1 Tax=Methylotenera versatilis TaxID=1055487 RepID=UPI000647EFFE|nr:EAL domain-containing protein [Methylotenera versatilis]